MKSNSTGRKDQLIHRTEPCDPPPPPPPPPPPFFSVVQIIHNPSPQKQQQQQQKRKKERKKENKTVCDQSQLAKVHGVKTQFTPLNHLYPQLHENTLSTDARRILPPSIIQTCPNTYLFIFRLIKRNRKKERKKERKWGGGGESCRQPAHNSVSGSIRTWQKWLHGRFSGSKKKKKKKNQGNSYGE